MSYDKEERAGLDRLVKEITSWDGEQVKSIQLDTYSSKGRSEELAMPLINICNNITDAVEKLIVWHKYLTTYREGDAVYIEVSTGHPDMLE